MVAQTPVIFTNGVVNAATYSAFFGVAPGSAASILGTNLSASTASASSLPLATSLAGTSVTVNGINAPLFYVSPTQINFQVPWELTASTNQLVVTTASGSSAPYTLSTPQIMPGIVTASGAGATVQILHSDYSLVTNSSPALGGETVMVLATGLGPVTPTVADGAAAPSSPPALLNSTVTATVGGLASSVVFAGLAPGSVGYDRVDVVVPSGLAAGSNSLSLEIANSVIKYVTGASFYVAAGTSLPVLSVGGTVNGASFAFSNASNGPIAPGAIVSIFGSNLAPSVASYLSAPLSTSLNGVSVSINGLAAPLFYTSPAQLNAQVPYSVVTGSGTVTVSRGGNTSVARTVNVGSVSPGLFSVGQNGSGAAIAFHADGRLITGTAPAFPGESIMTFGNGFGPLSSSVPEGTKSPSQTVTTVNTPLVDVGGIPAVVTFSGLAPGFIGVNQMNLNVPEGLPTSSGTSLQVVNLNGIASNIVTLAVLANGGTITASSLNGSPGSSAAVPVTLVLGTGVTADNVSFTLTVAPNAGAPAISGSFSFQPSGSITSFSSSGVTNGLAVSSLMASSPLSGTVSLGTVLVPVPSGTAGTSYSLQVSAASASRASASLNVLPGANGTLTIKGGSVNFGAAEASPGATVSIPVNLVLPAGTTVDSVSFGMQLNPVAGAPAIAGPMTFVHDSGIPATPFEDSPASNSIAVAFLSLPAALSGTVHLGNIQTVIPAGAAIGQTYTGNLTTASASLGNSPVALVVGPSLTIPVLTTYLVGDVHPYTSNVAGNFGDGLLNTLDLIDTLRAVTAIPGFVPASCTDRFDAMDAAPVDTATVRGGDGVLNTLDLVEILKRVTGLDTTARTRAARGSCSSVPAADAFRRGPAVGSIWVDEAQLLGDGRARVPVYLRAGENLDLAGLSFAVGVDGQVNSVQFVPAEVGPPSLTDNGVPGTLALAWLNGLQLPARTLLIGYIEVSGVSSATNFSVRFYGVDAGLRETGRSVQFETRRR